MNTASSWEKNRQNFEKIATYVMANAGKEFSAKNIGSYFENLNEEQIDKKTISRDGISHINIVGFLLGKKKLMLT